MARIVLGLATSHTPMLNLTAQQWQHRAEVDYANARLNLSDGRRVTYEQLLAERGPRYRDDVALAVLEKKERACQASLNRLADALEQANPDVVIIVGDDQAELFSSDNQPAFAVYHGEEIITYRGKYGNDAPDWMRQVGRGYLMDDVYRLPGDPGLAVQLIEGLMDQEVDVASAASVKDPAKAGFGHAYGFIVKRLFRRRGSRFSLYLPLGRKLRAVVEAMPGEQRIAVIASGGLSHFVVDEELDLRVIEALKARDVQTLRSIPRAALKSGSSETLNWILTAGAVDAMPMRMAEYQALYRTEAGTGVGAAFTSRPSASASCSAMRNMLPLTTTV